MESDIIKAYTAYRLKLSEFVATLKGRVKAESSVNAVCDKLGITRNMYYQRLNYPQNIAYDEVTALAGFLKDDSISSIFLEAIELGRNLSSTLTAYLKDAKVTVTFICNKLQMDTSNFYRKQNDPRLWSQEEIEKISHIVETMKSL